MKRSKHQRDTSDNDDSAESEVEKKVKRKHKKSHSKHEAHKKKAKKEETESSSSDLEDEKVDKVKKSHHKKKKKKVKQEFSSSSSSNSSSSSSSESKEEKVKKSHHKKKKKKREHSNEKVRIKEDLEEVEEEKPRTQEERRHHHHKHRHHRDRSDVEKHGHSSRPDRDSSRPERDSNRPDRESKWNEQSNEQETNNREPDRRIKEERTSQERDRRHDRNREERRSHQRPEHSGNRNKKPFCDNASEEYEWGKKDNKHGGDNDAPQEPKQKPNFGLSGKLTEDTNMFNGVVIKYSEPLDARKPKRKWRLYPFKGETGLPVLHIHRQSAFLMGRDRKVADIPVDHPSCSKQHAALQYRLTDYTREDGTKGKRIRLYIIDLESANGTFVNNKRIDPKRYVELLEKDVIKFGFSSREYVLLHEHSKDSDADDDVQED